MNWIKELTKQDGFGTISIDNTEKDHINIWFDEKKDSNVVMVKRENIPMLIDELNRCYTIGKEELK